MLSSLRQTLISFLPFSRQGPDHTIMLPAPPGPYAVAARHVQIYDPSRPTDPFSPSAPNIIDAPIASPNTINTSVSPPPRPIVLKIFYPYHHPQYNYPPPRLTKFHSPGTSRFFDRKFPFLRSTIHEGARINTPCAGWDVPLLARDADGEKENFPLILFSAGQGVMRYAYTNTAIALASQGYVVVLMDYAGETECVEILGEGRRNWGNGYDTDGAMVCPSEHEWGREEEEKALEMRVQDTGFVLDEMQKRGIFLRIGEGGLLNGRKVGMVGHCMGGNTAAMTMRVDERITAGVNMDGVFHPEVASEGLNGPFMMMRSQQSPLDEADLEDRWDTFWKNTRGWKKEIVVKGTKHMDWSDYPLLWEEMGVWDKVPDGEITKEQHGTIEPKRMMEIQAAYMGAFFDRALKGVESDFFEGNSSRFPEVGIVR